jgi:uncharacterized membrane protein
MAPDPTFAFVGGPWCPTLDFAIAFWIMIYVSHIVNFAILYVTWVSTVSIKVNFLKLCGRYYMYDHIYLFNLSLGPMLSDISYESLNSSWHTDLDLGSRLSFI